LPLVYTRRFVARYEATKTYDLVWTPDATHVWIVRDIVLANQSASAAPASQVWIQAGSAAYVLAQASLAAGEARHFELRQEILPGEPVRAGTGQPGWSLIITGYAFAPAG